MIQIGARKNPLDRLIEWIFLRSLIADEEIAAFECQSRPDSIRSWWK